MSSLIARQRVASVAVARTSTMLRLTTKMTPMLPSKLSLQSTRTPRRKTMRLLFSSSKERKRPFEKKLKRNASNRNSSKPREKLHSLRQRLQDAKRKKRKSLRVRELMKRRMPCGQLRSRLNSKNSVSLSERVTRCKSMSSKS